MTACISGGDLKIPRGREKRTEARRLESGNARSVLRLLVSPKILVSVVAQPHLVHVVEELGPAVVLKKLDNRAWLVRDRRGRVAVRVVSSVTAVGPRSVTGERVGGSRRS